MKVMKVRYRFFNVPEVGSATLAYCPEPAGSNRYLYGLAFCNESKDKYNKNVGRNIARGRLVQAYACSVTVYEKSNISYHIFRQAVIDEHRKRKAPQKWADWANTHHCPNCGSSKLLLAFEFISLYKINKIKKLEQEMADIALILYEEIPKADPSISCRSCGFNSSIVDYLKNFVSS